MDGGDASASPGVDDAAWRARLGALRIRAWPNEATAAMFDAEASQTFLVPVGHAKVLDALAPGQPVGEAVLRARFEGLDVCRILQELEEAGFVRRQPANASGS